MGSQDSRKLGERFVVKRNHIAAAPAVLGAFRQAIPECVYGKAGIVFDSCEPLFLGGCHNVAIANQRGGGIMIKGADPQNVHVSIGARVIFAARVR